MKTALVTALLVASAASASRADSPCPGAAKPFLQVRSTVHHGWLGGVTPLPGGGQLVAACEFRQRQPRTCEMRRFDQAGRPLGEAVPLFEWKKNCFGSPAFTRLADGSLVLAWSCSPPSDGSTTWIWVQRLDAEGRLLGAPFAAEPPRADAQSTPLVVSRMDGGFWVLWTEEPGSSRSATTLWGRRFAPEGTAASAAEPLSPVGAVVAFPFVAAAGLGGDLFVAWSGTGPGSRSQPEIYLRRIDASGRLSDPVRVSDERPRTYGANVEPALAVSPQGVAVVWTRRGEEPQRTWFRLFSPSLEPQGPERRLDEGAEGGRLDLAPQVEASGSGFLAAWLRFDSDGLDDRAEMMMRAITPLGALGPPVRVLENLSPIRKPILLTEGTAPVVVYGLRFVGDSGPEVELTGCRLSLPPPPEAESRR